MADQSFETHRKFVPGYHFVLLSIALLNLLWSLYRVYHAIHIGGGRFLIVDSLFGLLVAVGLAFIAIYVRTFPLRAQDRVIRLEESIRLRTILPDELKGRVPELTASQLIALRFAGDAELPGLVRQILDGKLTGRDDIKKQIKDWRADHLRM